LSRTLRQTPPARPLHLCWSIS